MVNVFHISQEEKYYLRELAKKCIEYACLPVMEEKAKLWYRHNSLTAERPLIVMELETFESDFLPPLKCKTSAGKEIEYQLIKEITNFELIADDKVISPYYTVEWKIDFQLFGIELKRDFAEDNEGRKIGYKQHHLISDLKNDMHKLSSSKYSVDREYTLEWKRFVEDVLLGIMPVKLKNTSLRWHIAPTAKIVRLMGLEKMMYSILDYPDEMHELMKFITDDIMTYVKWQESEDLLTLNNENDYTGAGSYGFTDKLPTDECKRTGIIKTKDLWVNMNSQESVGISPQMFEEFIFPYYYDIAKEFGTTYFGCCEPVHEIWDNCISKLSGIKKVSISPWCDEEYMGSVLAGSGVIYSRKPSPNFIGVGKVLDEEGFEKHIKKTLSAAKGCQLEFISRDIYSLSGDRSKPGRAVEIIRKSIDQLW